jgi:hypothetical protein
MKRADVFSFCWLALVSAVTLGATACGRWGNSVPIGGAGWGGGDASVDGGGGSTTIVGVDTSLTVAPASLRFVLAPSADASQTQTVKVTFKGDGVVAGYPTGVTPAPWLTVQQIGAVAGDTVSFALTARTSDALERGEHRTSVRFATGKLAPGADLSQATDVIFVDVAVRLTVAVGIEPAEIFLAVIDGSGETPALPGGGAFSLNGTSAWTATSDAPWLTLGRARGTAPSQLPFAVNASGLEVGVHVANVEVRSDGRTAKATVTLSVTAPELTTSVDELAFTVDAATTRAQLSRSLVVSDEIGGKDPKRAASWKVQSIDAPWLVPTDVVPASGRTSPPAAVAVTLDPARIEALANGDLAGTLTLSYLTEDGQAHTTTVKLSLHLSLPRVQWVAPYVVYAGQEPEVIVRGTGFDGAAGRSVVFGETAATKPTMVSDTELRVTCPVLAPGEVTVQIPNALGLPAARSRLVVRAAGALPAAALEVVGRKWRLVFDDERQVLYGVDIDRASLARVALRGNTWAVLPPFPVEKLQDAALSTDGRSLVMATDGAGIFELDLTDTNASPRRVIADGSLFSSLAFTNHGVAIVTTSAHGSGNTPVFSYDVLSKRLSPLTIAGHDYGLYAARAYASGDGRRVLLSQNGLSPPPGLVEFDAAVDATSETPIHRNILRVALNRDASRMIVDGVVYDQSYNPLGKLGDDLHELRVLLSPDGQRAYASRYEERDGTAKPADYVVYDLKSPPDTANVYPLLSTIALSPLLKESPDNYYSPLMTLSGDGLTMFIWGGTAVQIVPLSP